MESQREVVEQKRTRYDIYADVIGILSRSNGCSLTRVSHGANISLKRAKKDLIFLASHGFIRERYVGGSKRYEAAKWGIKYHEAYKYMHRFFAALREPVATEFPNIVLPGRVTTGYKELDNMLYGGIPGNCVVVLSSASCDERGLLIKRFLDAGAKERQETLYATSDPGNMKALLKKFGSNLYLIVCNPNADMTVDSLPHVLTLKGVENLTDIQFAFIAAFRELAEKPTKPRRACIEIVSDVLLQHHAVATRRWLSGLIPELRSRGFTTLAVVEPQMHHSEEAQAILGLFEGEISIYERETEKGLEKFLKIRKMCNQRYVENELPLRKETLFMNN
jgi:predicted transcriptional regulator/KaiC/GvpD/RAD55 family RecA-like ATPase